MTDPRLNVIEGVTLTGSTNTDDATMRAHIAHAIRQGFPQVKPAQERYERIALVGSGPSLNETIDELRQAVFEGAYVVALNGSYHWLIEHNIHPKAVVVLDARASNARFVMPAIPRCKYYVASQCHPDMWAALKPDGRHRPETYIFHAVTPDNEAACVLDGYYGKGRWYPIIGGTTVATRALALLRLGGFVRFDWFGIDSCWFGDAHHAFPQPENSADRLCEVKAYPTGHPELLRVFHASPWHLKQVEDVLQMMRVNGHKFTIAVHGDGLIAHVITSLGLAGDVVLSEGVH